MRRQDSPGLDGSSNRHDEIAHHVAISQVGRQSELHRLTALEEQRLVRDQHLAFGGLLRNEDSLLAYPSLRKTDSRSDDELAAIGARLEHLRAANVENRADFLDCPLEEVRQGGSRQGKAPELGNRLLLAGERSEALLVERERRQRALGVPLRGAQALDDLRDDDCTQKKHHGCEDRVARGLDPERVRRLEEEVVVSGECERRGQKAEPEPSGERRHSHRCQIEGTDSRLSLEAGGQPDPGGDARADDRRRERLATSAPAGKTPAAPVAAPGRTGRAASCDGERQGRRLARVVHERQAPIEQRNLEDTLDDLGTANENEGASRLPSTYIGLEEQSQAARVDERHVSQVDHEPGRRTLLDALELGLDRGSTDVVEFADERDESAALRFLNRGVESAQR